MPAQQKRTDSLQKELRQYNGQSSKAKVVLLLALSDSYLQTNTDSMLATAKVALLTAESIHDALGTINSLVALSNAYSEAGNYDTSLYYSELALPLARRVKDDKKIATILQNIGESNYYLCHYDRAIDYADSSMRLYKKLRDTLSIAQCLAMYGNIYMGFGNYNKAAECATKAARIFEQQHFNAGLPVCYAIIASAYETIGDFDRALPYHLKALKISTAEHNERDICSGLNNIAYMYNGMKNYPKALEYYNASLAVADKLRDDNSRTLCLSNIANLYYDMKSYDSALYYFNMVSPIAERSGNAEALIICYAGIGKTMVQKKMNIPKAIEYIKKAVSQAREIGNKQLICDASFDLSEAYAANGNYAQAYELHKIYSDYTDTIHREKDNRKIRELQFNYEIEKKQHEITKLESANLLSQEEDKEQRQLLIGLSIGIAGLILFSALLYRHQVKLQKSYELIHRQKQEMERQAADLKDLHTFKDRILSVISHDLRAPITTVSSFIGLLDDKMVEAADLPHIRGVMRERVDSVLFLIDNLLRWATTSFRNDTSARKEVLDLHQLTQMSTDLLQSSAAAKQITLDNAVPPATMALGDQDQINAVIRNLVSNAIKFTGANGTVSVAATACNGIITLTITDNGQGMTREQVRQAFTHDATSTHGTAGEKGVGLGLVLCREFVEMNGGTITVSSEVDKGTIFTILLRAA